MSPKFFPCFTCNRPLASAENRRQHEMKSHPKGALWADGELTVWREATIGLGDDMRYWAICEVHGFCVGTRNKREALSIKTTVEFCDVCAGTVQWCRTCTSIENPYGLCAEHDVAPGTLGARDVAEHDHGRYQHRHAYASTPHDHILRAVCGRSECTGCATHNVHQKGSSEQKVGA